MFQKLLKQIIYCKLLKNNLAYYGSFIIEHENSSRGAENPKLEWKPTEKLGNRFDVSRIRLDVY